MIGSERDVHEASPKFGLLEDILTFEDSNCTGSDIIFVVKVLKTVCFAHHFGAYLVEWYPTNVYSCFYMSSLKCHYLFNCVRVTQNMFIKSKYDLSGYCSS